MKTDELELERMELSGTTYKTHEVELCLYKMKS